MKANNPARNGHALRGAAHPNFGKAMSEETKRKVSEAKRGTQTGAANPFYGRKHSQETRRKMSTRRQAFFDRGGLIWSTGKKAPQLAGENAPRWKGVQDAHLLDLWGRGLTTYEISDSVGFSAQQASRRLKKLDIKPGERNTPHLCEDGHRVRSSYELAVDDWLTHHGLAHTYEPSIPASRWHADFSIGAVFVEIWGIVGVKEYEARRSLKVAHYHDLGLTLVELLPSDMPQLDTALESLLR